METLKELIIEHKRLVKVLEVDNPDQIKKEAQIQKKELQEYIKESLKKRRKKS
jgi:hypothetical protein